jgi:hypothetical protein
MLMSSLQQRIDMKIEPKANCPLHNFEPCKQLDCAWFLKIRGSNPNTGEDVDDWGCAIAWLPVLMIENSQQQRQTGAAVESFRNEMVKSNETSQQILISAAQRRLGGQQ